MIMSGYFLWMTAARIVNTIKPIAPPRMMDKSNIFMELVVLLNSNESMSYETDLNVLELIGLDARAFLVLVMVVSSNILSLFSSLIKSVGMNNCGDFLDERSSISLSIVKYPRR